MTTHEALKALQEATPATLTPHRIQALQAATAAIHELADLRAVTRQSEVTPARVALWQATAKDLLDAEPTQTLTAEDAAATKTTRINPRG